MKRLINLIRGFFYALIGKAEKSNPEILLENEKENLRKTISSFNASLASNAGLISSLEEKDKRMDSEAESLKNKIRIALEQENKEAAKAFAVRLQKIEKENVELEASLKMAKDQYEELVKARNNAIETAKKKLEAIESSLNEAKRNEALAEMTEMAAAMAIGVAVDRG